MDPNELGREYDRIAGRWQCRHNSSDYGVGPLAKALGFAPGSGKALDLGCGAGGDWSAESCLRHRLETGIARAVIIRRPLKITKNFP